MQPKNYLAQINIKLDEKKSKGKLANFGKVKFSSTPFAR